MKKRAFQKIIQIYFVLSTSSKHSKEGFIFFRDTKREEEVCKQTVKKRNKQPRGERKEQAGRKRTLMKIM